MHTKIRSIWYVTERRENVRLAKQDDNKIVVIVKTAVRDAKSKKIKYETVESLDVFEAKGDDVVEVVKTALMKAASGK